jgi:hypothetical protein
MSTPARPAQHACPLSSCPNCGHAFRFEQPVFCPACGQETHIQPPTLREFAQQFGGAYFSTEGALWRTLKLLLLKPGELTAQYLAGRRKHYVLPLRLFLSATVLMLLVMRISSSMDLAAVDDADLVSQLPLRPRSIQLELGLGRAGLDEGVFYCEGLPDWLCRRLKARLDLDTQSIMRQMQRVSDRVANNAGGVMCALMPAFALGLWLVWRNRRMRYTEHLVFALHLHAFWCLVVAFMLTGVTALVLAGLLMIPLYGVLALRRVYGGRWWVLLLRSSLLGTAHLVLVTVTGIGVALAALLF